MPQTSYDQVLLSCSGGMRAGKAEEGGRGTGSERGGGVLLIILMVVVLVT